MTPEAKLLRRIRLLTALFIVGLVLSGATAIPLQTELDWLVNATGAQQFAGPVTATITPVPVWAEWLLKVQAAVSDTLERHPFLGYGTDWLAFGHFMIALSFVGALRDPVRNRWLFDFGLIACLLVIPYVLTFGAVRGIPFWWRLIDCSFGVFGFVPLWFCRRWTSELKRRQTVST